MNAALDMDIRQRQGRWERLASTPGRGGFLFIIRWADPGEPPRPSLWPEFARERVEWIWGDYQRHLARAHALQSVREQKS